VSTATNDAVWGQFGAAFDMLENAIWACPDDVWGERPGWQEFWYITFHALWWTDCYLSESCDAYVPPAPFTRDELDPAGVLPERVYGKDELLRFLADCRRKCRDQVAAMTAAEAAGPTAFVRQASSRLELYLYNLRHLQHHVGQLNTILRQRTDSAPGWVKRAGAAS
jgi:hypothetical protein